MLKVGIIGAGRIGKVHTESITKYVPNAEVKAIADPFMNDATAEWAKSMGVKEVYKDYKEILNDPEIEAVLVCSSTNTHSEISIEALRAGKNVFCEKPVDHDLGRIKNVLEEVKKSGKKFQVGFNRRFDHNFKAIKDAVLAGKVGDPHIIRVTSRDPEAPPAEYVKVSGGIFLDMTIHDFDMVRFLSGSEVEEVYANGAVLVDPAIGEAGDIDTAIITLKFANGALGVIDNSRRAAYGYDQRAEVFGSKGAVATANDTLSTAVISTEEGISSEKPLYFFLERYMQSFAEEIRQFVNAIVNDTEVPVNANDGLQPVLIGLAAKKSLEEGRPVKLSEFKF
ncbi:inositol 2-dehydrogenase [Clostridium botulinum C]|uniref:Inositol 2-dehydrogenase n=5 Tax=Clostridium TaxID=1485 RepID=A0A9Q4TKR7_CLOBO|nr:MULTISPECIES: inositol 2-dehydrogenase [Clostridium]EGO88262.1 oxidoreductase [Clostridium botulinum C str. Stockholm]EES90485.1 inositol 2-dehydrogenase [Clostridium botulinum D str. 1873]KEI09627.1 oxidoreductase [Clostridium sp. K25]KEI14500.1 oxidoreductase [Clostridium novyi B str. NCTC 9691]KEI15477.1 oxidoreductase [Clostridium haemolyticum NCTC 9693]